MCGVYKENNEIKYRLFNERPIEQVNGSKVLGQVQGCAGASHEKDPITEGAH